MQNRIGHKWLSFGLFALIAVMSQAVRADVHTPVFSDQPPGASRPIDQERTPGLLLGPRRYVVRQRTAAQGTKTTVIVRGYRGFLPLQGQRRTNVLIEDGSFLDEFCSVYDGLCPESRRFALPAEPARQLIVQTGVTTQHYRQLADHYALNVALGGARYQATTDQQQATTMKARVGLSTPASHPLQHGLFLRSAYVSSAGSDRTQNVSAQTVTLGYRQRLRLSAELSSVLLGVDNFVWEVARGQSSRQSGTADQTSVHFAQHWDRDPYFVRISADWRSHHPPAANLSGSYDQHIQMIDTGLSASSSSVFASMFNYVHIRSVGISYARIRTQFSHPLLWQVVPQDTKESQTSIMISGAYLTPNFAPFLVLQERNIHQSALALPGRRYMVSLGIAIQF